MECHQTNGGRGKILPEVSESTATPIPTSPSYHKSNLVDEVSNEVNSLPDVEICEEIEKTLLEVSAPDDSRDGDAIASEDSNYEYDFEDPFDNNEDDSRSEDVNSSKDDDGFCGFSDDDEDDSRKYPFVYRVHHHVVLLVGRKAKKADETNSRETKINTTIAEQIGKIKAEINNDLTTKMSSRDTNYATKAQNIINMINGKYNEIERVLLQSNATSVAETYQNNFSRINTDFELVGRMITTLQSEINQRHSLVQSANGDLTSKARHHYLPLIYQIPQIQTAGLKEDLDSIRKGVKRVLGVIVGLLKDRISVDNSQPVRDRRLRNSQSNG
ncbi:11569_t:CDS:2 [Ambispora leptoticha]|uniref:11569_t:CDS:1 n=1 Tax=Ambispora leptoticha TaxID=144679 RepID=A0A9N9AB77_9GLOM|nr:11569_t:CDS:2 [Ambispora leptoticha]